MLLTVCPSVCLLLTRLDEPHVQDLVHLAVVGGDVEHQLGVVPHAGDVDRHQVLAHLLPLDSSRPRGGHMEHFSPQSRTQSINILISR